MIFCFFRWIPAPLSTGKWRVYGLPQLTGMAVHAMVQCIVQDPSSLMVQSGHEAKGSIWETGRVSAHPLAVIRHSFAED